MFIKIARAIEAKTKLTYAFPGEPATVADPGAYVYTVFTFALGIVGLAALAFLVYGGIRYILSAGNPSALADAKDRMTAALIGIVLLLSSYLILNTIDPRLLQLTITDIQPAMPRNINFAAIDALVDEAIALINNGDIAGAKAKREEARKMGEGVNELRVFEGELISKNPAAAAKFFTEGLDSGEQRMLILRAALNRLGAPGYNAQSEYNPSQLVQLVPVETLYGLYWTFPPEAQRDTLSQMSDDQRRAFYWNFGDPKKGGNPYQQATYLSRLNDFNRSRLYLDLQSDGQGHGAQLAHKIVTLNNSREALREIVGTWASLPKGAARKTFLQQVEDAGWDYDFDELSEEINARYTTQAAGDSGILGGYIDVGKASRELGDFIVDFP